jgi:hypothetical protein
MAAWSPQISTQPTSYTEQVKLMIANRIYSVNLAAFIYMVAKIQPSLDADVQGQVFFLFPDTPEVSLIIGIYRKNHVSVDLKEYLSSYRYIRDLIKKHRGVKTV